MKKVATWILCAALVATGSATASAAQLVPLTSFGGGDGWLAPGEGALGTGANLARGLTYNPLNNRVYVVDREGATAVKILDGDTGAQVGTLDVTGVTGGTFPLNMIDVDDQGVIYAANLSTSATSNFKIYRWADESSAPAVVFDAPSGRIRTGDTFAVSGSGASTKMVAAGGSNATDSAFAFFTTADGLSYSVATPAVSDVATGAFRLGIDLGEGLVVGLQTGGNLAVAAETGGPGQVVPVNSAGEAPFAWDSAENLGASIDVNSSLVRLYSTTDLALLTSTGLLDTANNTTAFVGNGNGVGDLKFGRLPSGQLRLYALNTNNGIQAFAVVPEPTSALLATGVALALAGLRRRYA